MHTPRNAKRSKGCTTGQGLGRRDGGRRGRRGRKGNGGRTPAIERSHEWTRIDPSEGSVAGRDKEGCESGRGRFSLCPVGKEKSDRPCGATRARAKERKRKRTVKFTQQNGDEEPQRGLRCAQQRRQPRQPARVARHVHGRRQCTFEHAARRRVVVVTVRAANGYSMAVLRARVLVPGLSGTFYQQRRPPPAANCQLPRDRLAPRFTIELARTARNARD